MGERPAEMVQAEVERLLGPGVAAEIQPLGEGLFAATIYASGGPDGDMVLSTVALFQIRAVLAGQPVELSVAPGQV